MLVVLAMLAATTEVQCRAAPRSHLPLHLLSVAAALRDAEAALSSEPEQNSGAAALSNDESLFSDPGALLSDQEDSPLERPPRASLAAPNSAEFAEFSGRTSRPRRSKKSRRRGGLRLDRKGYELWLRSGGEFSSLAGSAGQSRRGLVQ